MSKSAGDLADLNFQLPACDRAKAFVLPKRLERVERSRRFRCDDIAPCLRKKSSRRTGPTERRNASESNVLTGDVGIANRNIQDAGEKSRIDRWRLRQRKALAARLQSIVPGIECFGVVARKLGIIANQGLEQDRSIGRNVRSGPHRAMLSSSGNGNPVLTFASS